VAESFGTNADRYDRARPRYPDALTARITGPEVLDVGCGTGIVARQLQATGCSVLGVEPDPRMAEFARQQGVEVEEARLEEWDPRGRVFDAVVAGQTWHWVDPVAGAAKAASVLRPGGRLTVFWNAHQVPDSLKDAFNEVYRGALPEFAAALEAQATSDPYAVMAGAAVAGMRDAGGFGEAEEWRFAWERVYTRDEWLDQVPTHGGMNRLPAAALGAVLAGVGAAIDGVGGSFTMPYSTVAVSAVRRA
jgi:SAM-dependent methyltransferase